MKQNKSIIAIFLCLVSFYSVAKSNDLQQEVKIKAVRQSADIKNNQIIFYGPVEVSQGSIHINADELKAFTEGKDEQRILVATGNPATYEQTLDDGRPASASAKQIRYNLANRTLTLLGNATLDQAGSQVTGNQIRYNINKQQLIAESKGNDRVITIIQPQTYQEDTKPSEENKEESSNQEKSTSTTLEQPLS